VAVSVITAFVTSSPSPFNLGVEEIIYLNDIGVPGLVVNAMMQRDQALKGLSANASSSPPAPEPGAPAAYEPQPAEPPAPPPMPPEGPPPADYPTGDYLPPPPEDTGYSTFYDSLAPYGTWVDVAGYGPCWQPTVVIANPTWRPYCNAGRWVYTDCGWYWLSGYSWGWAPFHYGRWFQHHQLGWCWAPDRVWGPSWVCWRSGGSYCGWAPLPPGAWYRPGAGLTYRGQSVRGAFGFGLSAKTFTFVGVSHLRDSHLNRHALPLAQAAQVYHTTTASGTIVGHNNQVINSGIPAGRVAAATGKEVHPTAIHELNAAAGQGTRGERFEGSSRTMSVTHPQFPASTGTKPATSGRPRSELRNGGSIPAAGATAVGGARAISTMRSDPAPKTAAPLILHGPDRPAHYTAGTTVGSSSEIYPPKALVVIGNKDVNPPRSVRQSSAWTTERAQPRSTEWTTSARSETAWSAPRHSQSPAYSEQQRQSSTPSYHTQVTTEAWRSAPAPAPAPQLTHSYSSPTPSFTPHAQAVESHPSYSPPSAPAASAPASHAGSSSDKSRR
jgi:hypothetical protein